MAQVGTVEIDAQYRQLREECGVLDRSARGKLLVEGSEAAEYLQGQLTNDVEALAVGEGCYAALLDRKGHMQADMRVLNLSDAPLPGIAGQANTGAFWIDTEPDAIAATRRHLEMYKIGRDVELSDATEGRAIVSLVGPRSVELAGSPPLSEHASAQATVEGIGCLAVGTAFGVDLIAAAADRERLIATLAVAGAPEVGAEAGIVERAVSFTKGCYIGQETVARLHYKGKPNRHLRGLRLSAPAAPGAALQMGEKEVGRVGGSSISPVHGPIALAIVRREAEPGAELRVGEDGVTARVVDLPFG